MRRLSAIVVVVLLSTVAFFGSRHLTAADDRQKPAAEMDFTGKYVVIHQKKTLGGASTPIMKNVAVKLIGGQAHLTGEYATDVQKSADHWKGAVIAVPMDNLIAMMIFNSREQAEAVRKEAEGNQKKES
jgi:hypothetical protein